MDNTNRHTTLYFNRRLPSSLNLLECPRSTFTRYNCTRRPSGWFRFDRRVRSTVQLYQVHCTVVLSNAHTLLMMTSGSSSDSHGVRCQSAWIKIKFIFLTSNHIYPRNRGWGVGGVLRTWNAPCVLSNILHSTDITLRLPCLCNLVH